MLFVTIFLTTSLLHAEQKLNWQETLNQLQKKPESTSGYFYNLGTVYYRVGQVGRAVAFLEKANHVHPHDSDIQYNLSVAQAALSKTIGPENLDPSSSWAEKIADRTTLDEVRATLGLLAVIVVLLWTRAYLATRKVRTAILQPAGILSLIGFILTTAIYGTQRWASGFPAAVCLDPLVIRSGPGESYLPLSRVESGVKLRILEASEGAWQQVRYSQDGIGWVKASELLVI